MGNILVEEVRQIIVTDIANSWTSALDQHIPHPLWSQRSCNLCTNI